MRCRLDAAAGTVSGGAIMDYGYYNMDCMDGMREFPDKFFDIAIVDPPYFSGPERRKFFGQRVSPIGV